MSRLKFSTQARTDLFEVGQYSVGTWGLRVATRYIDELQACCERLAKFPASARRAKLKRHKLRRMEQGSHVIFFREEDKNIVIVRILHGKMLIEEPMFDES